MKTRSIFKFLLAGAVVGTLTLTSCESGDTTKDSNSETTEGDVNDPTKYNSGSNTSTRTGGSMGLNHPDKQDASNLVSEHQRNKNQNKEGRTTNGETSDKSGMNTSASGSDLGGTSSSTQNITKDPRAKNKGAWGTTGSTGRASGIHY